MQVDPLKKEANFNKKFTRKFSFIHFWNALSLNTILIQGTIAWIATKLCKVQTVQNTLNKLKSFTKSNKLQL